MGKEISRQGFVHSGTSLKALKLILFCSIFMFFEGFVRFLYFCSCLLNV